VLHLQDILIAFEILQSDIVVVAEKPLQSSLLLFVLLFQVVVVVRKCLVSLLKLFVYCPYLGDFFFLLSDFLLNFRFVGLLSLFQFLNKLL